MRIKVSIIIPVYNTAEYLEKCLKSILNQDLESIEILIIDDASTDNSYQILENFKNNDERIVLNKLEHNQGQAKARNWGICHASGDYILFLDSDDFLETNVLKKLYNTVLLENLDILEARHFRLYDARKIEYPSNFKSLNKALPGDKFWKESGNISVVVWDKIWKRTFLVENNISFEDRKFEDVDFVVRAFMKAEKVKNIDLFIYNYLIRNNSTMTSLVVPQKVQDYVGLTQELDRLSLMAATLEMKEAIQKLLNYNFLSAPDYFREIDNEEVRNNFLKFKKIYNKHRWSIITNKPTNFLLRIFIFINPFLANKMYKKFKP